MVRLARTDSSLFQLASELARGPVLLARTRPDPARVGTRAWSGLRAWTRADQLAPDPPCATLTRSPVCAHRLARRPRLRVSIRASPSLPDGLTADSPRSLLIHRAFTARAGGRSRLIQLARMNPRHPMHPNPMYPANPHQHSSLSAQRSTLSDAAARARARQRPAHRPPARRPLGRHGRRPASAPAASRRDRRRPRPARP